MLDPISQRLPLHFRVAWAEWHKKDVAGQWAVINGLPNHPLNAPRVAQGILHGMYSHILWWVVNLVATPQQKFPAGSPFNVQVRRVPAEQALRVLEASTVSASGRHGGPGCGSGLAPIGACLRLPSSAFHLASSLRHHMVSCTLHELLCTPRVPKFPLAVCTAPGVQDASALGSSRAMTLGGFIPDDGPTPPTTGSAAWSTKQVLDTLVHEVSVPIDLPSQFQTAFPAVTFGGHKAQLRCLTEDIRQVCEKPHVSEDVMQSTRRDFTHPKRMHDDAAIRLEAIIVVLQVQVTKLVRILESQRAADAN